MDTPDTNPNRGQDKQKPQDENSIFNDKLRIMGEKIGQWSAEARQLELEGSHHDFVEYTKSRTSQLRSTGRSAIKAFEGGDMKQAQRLFDKMVDQYYAKPHSGTDRSLESLKYHPRRSLLSRLKGISPFGRSR